MNFKLSKKILKRIEHSNFNFAWKLKLLILAAALSNRFIIDKAKSKKGISVHHQILKNFDGSHYTKTLKVMQELGLITRENWWIENVSAKIIHFHDDWYDQQFVNVDMLSLKKFRNNGEFKININKFKEFIHVGKISYDLKKINEIINSYRWSEISNFQQLSTAFQQGDKLSPIQLKIFRDVKQLMSLKDENKVQVKTAKQVDRKYTFFSNMIKSLRAAVLINGVRLKEVDINNSHVLLILSEFAKWKHSHNIDNDNFLIELNTLAALVKTGDFYQAIIDKEKSQKITREKFKRAFIIMLYDKSVKRWNIAYRFLKGKFDYFLRYLEHVKNYYGAQQYSLKIQAQEAAIVNPIAQNYQLLSIYDSWLVPEENKWTIDTFVEKTNKIIEDNLHPVLKGGVYLKVK